MRIDELGLSEDLKKILTEAGWDITRDVKEQQDIPVPNPDPFCPRTRSYSLLTWGVYNKQEELVLNCMTAGVVPTGANVEYAFDRWWNPTVFRRLVQYCPLETDPVLGVSPLLWIEDATAQHPFSHDYALVGEDDQQKLTQKYPLANGLAGIPVFLAHANRWRGTIPVRDPNSNLAILMAEIYARIVYSEAFIHFNTKKTVLASHIRFHAFSNNFDINTGPHTIIADYAMEGYENLIGPYIRAPKAQMGDSVSIHLRLWLLNFGELHYFEREKTKAQEKAASQYKSHPGSEAKQAQELAAVQNALSTQSSSSSPTQSPSFASQSSQALLLSQRNAAVRSTVSEKPDPSTGVKFSQGS